MTTAGTGTDDTALEAHFADYFAAIEARPQVRYETGGIRNYPAAGPLLAEDPATARRVALFAARVFDSEVDASPPERTPERSLAPRDRHPPRPAARDTAGSVNAEDPNLQLYYTNRVRSFAVDIAPRARDADRVAAHDIETMEIRG